MVRRRPVTIPVGPQLAPRFLISFFANVRTDKNSIDYGAAEVAKVTRANGGTRTAAGRSKWSQSATIRSAIGAGLATRRIQDQRHILPARHPQRHSRSGDRSRRGTPLPRTCPGVTRLVPKAGLLRSAPFASTAATSWLPARLYALSGELGRPDGAELLASCLRDPFPVQGHGPG